MNDAAHPTKDTKRFDFGENWTRFLKILNNDRIVEAERSLKLFLGVDGFDGLSFVDVGSGSGLYSLAARQLKAHVHSFDIDPKSVACTQELKRRYFPNDDAWVVEQGSAMDTAYLSTLGTFDIVYSWGVLHHSSSLWEALHNVAMLTAPAGKLMVSIYNDQGLWSIRWRRIKKIFNHLPKCLQPFFVFAVMVPRDLWTIFTVECIIKCTFWKSILEYVAAWKNYQKNRGMSMCHDMIDWIGGYPFEVAKPEDVFLFIKKRGFILENLTTCAGGIGCNQYLFSRIPTEMSAGGERTVVPRKQC